MPSRIAKTYSTGKFPVRIAEHLHHPSAKIWSHMSLPKISNRCLPPEIDLLVLSFLGHFAWEILQAPLFSSLAQVDHFVAIRICLQATLGDLVIALVAFWCAALAGKGRDWIARAHGPALITFIAVGLLVTVGLEYLHTEVTGRWSYDPAMPRLPILGTGLSPILQWVFVPLLVVWFMRRLAVAKPDRLY